MEQLNKSSTSTVVMETGTSPDLDTCDTDIFDELYTETVAARYLSGNCINSYDTNVTGWCHPLTIPGKANLSVISFQNGDVYQGETILNGTVLIGHGQGSYITYDNASEYKGGFENGNPSGFGTYRFKIGSEPGSYTGEWKDGMFNGRGTLTLPDYTYSGDFVNNLFSGVGKITFNTGDVYDGPWLNGKRHGCNGTHTTKCWSYVGGYSHNQYHGRGKLTYVVGIYEGDFVSNDFHGEGEMNYSNGDKYVGNWSKDDWHGQGTMYCAKDNSTSKGQFMNGKLYNGAKVTPNVVVAIAFGETINIPRTPASTVVVYPVATITDDYVSVAK